MSGELALGPEPLIRSKLEVVYPCVIPTGMCPLIEDMPGDLKAKCYILSLNRYEMKKDHMLAVQAFESLLVSEMRIAARAYLAHSKPEGSNRM